MGMPVELKSFVVPHPKFIVSPSLVAGKPSVYVPHSAACLGGVGRIRETPRRGGAFLLCELLGDLESCHRPPTLPRSRRNGYGYL